MGEAAHDRRGGAGGVGMTGHQIPRTAPPFRAEDHVGASFAGLDALRGKPVVLFFSVTSRARDVIPRGDAKRRSRDGRSSRAP